MDCLKASVRVGDAVVTGVASSGVAVQQPL